MLGTVRRSSVRQHVLAMAPTGRGSRNLARLLENAVAKAAETAKVEAKCCQGFEIGAGIPVRLAATANHAMQRTRKSVQRHDILKNVHGREPLIATDLQPEEEEDHMKIERPSVHHIISLALALPILVISAIAGINMPSTLIPGGDLAWPLVLPALIGSTGIVMNALVCLTHPPKTM
jgi:hypothetical protein